MHRVAVPAQHIDNLKIFNVPTDQEGYPLHVLCSTLHYPAPWWSIETQSGLWLLKTDHVTWSRLDQSDHGDQQQGRNSESSVSKSDWAASSNVIIEIYHRSVSAVTILHAVRFLSAEIQYPESLKSVWQENAEINFNIFVRNVRFRVS